MIIILTIIYDVFFFIYKFPPIEVILFEVDNDYEDLVWRKRLNSHNILEFDPCDARFF
jgi:hypothetical protein